MLGEIVYDLEICLETYRPEVRIFMSTSWSNIYSFDWS